MRAALRILAGTVVGVFVWQAAGGLRFTPTGATNRISDYAAALILLPFALTALYLLMVGLRWLLLALWPAAVRVECATGAIEFHLGPFGRSRFDAQRLSARYPYELDADDDEQQFEKFEDPEVQERDRLPVMTHPAYPGRLELLIRRFTTDDETALAEKMRPFLRFVRGSAVQGDTDP